MSRVSQKELDFARIADHAASGLPLPGGPDRRIDGAPHALALVRDTTMAYRLEKEVQSEIEIQVPE